MGFFPIPIQHNCFIKLPSDGNNGPMSEILFPSKNSPDRFGKLAGVKEDISEIWLLYNVNVRKLFNWANRWIFTRLFPDKFSCSSFCRFPIPSRSYIPPARNFNLVRLVKCFISLI